MSEMSFRYFYMVNYCCTNPEGGYQVGRIFLDDIVPLNTVSGIEALEQRILSSKPYGTRDLMLTNIHLLRTERQNK
jgi:hypothetical protein